MNCLVPSDWTAIDTKKQCEQAVRWFAGPIAFVTRSQFDVGLTTRVGPGGNTPYTGHFPGLSLPRIDTDRLRAVMSAHPLFGNALAEFALGIGRMIDTAFHCGRGLDILVQVVTGNDPERTSWPKFNAAPRTSKTYFDSLTALATRTRHGWLYSISEDQRIQCIEILAEAIERVAEWLERGGGDPLPAIEFSWL